MFDQASAKRFLANRIVRRAEEEGTPLPPAEKYMLAWSESDPGFKIDEKVIGDFERSGSEAAFESKISALLLRAYLRGKCHG